MRETMRRLKGSKPPGTNAPKHPKAALLERLYPVKKETAHVSIADISPVPIISKMPDYSTMADAMEQSNKALDLLEQLVNQTNNDAPPAAKSVEKISKYQQRYNDCKAWLESDKPSIHKMIQNQIIASLQEREKHKESREKLWSHGHKEFWEKQDLIEFKRGRNPK